MTCCRNMKSHSKKLVIGGTAFDLHVLKEKMLNTWKILINRIKLKIIPKKLHFTNPVKDGRICSAVARFVVLR